MNIFILNPLNSPLSTPQEVLDSPSVFGVSIDLPLQNFMMGGSSFNNTFFGQLKNEIKRINAYGKKVSLAIVCGYTANNIPNVPYITLIESHHQGQGDPHPISVPVPYDIKYLTYFNNFLSWFAQSLKYDPATYNAIDNIKITGINQQSPELRIPDQDFTGGDAFYNAAVKWKNLNYSTANVLFAINYLILQFKNYFQDKTLILPIISGLAGFPTINKSGAICKPNQRPDLTKEIITNYATPNNVVGGWCYLNPTSIPPFYISNNPAYYQTQNTKPKSRQDLVATIQNALSLNARILEIQYSIFKIYPL